ncbi:hypothetical protein TEP_05915 [Stenotrophomonas sp. TEPEL]|nr:hypothetical protein TEP_05915 [Stenotrophomonas sp. TEPEL]
MFKDLQKCRSFFVRDFASTHDMDRAASILRGCGTWVDETFTPPRAVHPTLQSPARSRPMRLHPALLACLLLFAAPALAAEPLRAVSELDIDRYAGQWHEIAHLPVSFQKQCVGEITANYGLRRDGRISVTNACRKADGERIVAEGVARPVAGQPGQLQVRFVPDWLSWVPLVWADYWVIALDPDYQWAMVGEPGRRYLWILARLPEMDRALFDRLKAKAEAMGYDLAPLRMMAPLRDTPAD